MLRPGEELAVVSFQQQNGQQTSARRALRRPLHMNGMHNAFMYSSSRSEA